MKSLVEANGERESRTRAVAEELSEKVIQSVHESIVNISISCQERQKAQLEIRFDPDRISTGRETRHLGTVPNGVLSVIDRMGFSVRDVEVIENPEDNTVIHKMTIKETCYDVTTLVSRGVDPRNALAYVQVEQRGNDPMELVDEYGINNVEERVEEARMTLAQWTRDKL